MYKGTRVDFKSLHTKKRNLSTIRRRRRRRRSTWKTDRTRSTEETYFHRRRRRSISYIIIFCDMPYKIFPPTHNNNRVSFAPAIFAGHIAHCRHKTHAAYIRVLYYQSRQIPIRKSICTLSPVDRYFASRPMSKALASLYPRRHARTYYIPRSAFTAN